MHNGLMLVLNNLSLINPEKFPKSKKFDGNNLGLN